LRRGDEGTSLAAKYKARAIRRGLVVVSNSLKR
jgi:hypothetical protein